MTRTLCLMAQILVFSVLAITSLTLHAQTRGPVQLEADTAEVSDADGLSIYRGNVVLTRDDTRITGSVMRVYTDSERELQRIEVEGDPATYRDIPLDGGAPRRAESPIMEYYAADPERIILRSGGRLWQGDNEVTGETITHFVTEGRTVADGSSAGGSGRVNVTVFPEQESEE